MSMVPSLSVGTGPLNVGTIRAGRLEVDASAATSVAGNAGKASAPDASVPRNDRRETETGPFPFIDKAENAVEARCFLHWILMDFTPGCWSLDFTSRVMRLTKK
ncbi:MAG: hypothetical protein ACREH8_13920 [Opitutaceae bacterium]